MRDYAKEAAAAGVGHTPHLCHDALNDMLRELFRGKTFSGKGGRREPRIFRQDLPIPEDDDADADREYAPYIVTRVSEGEIKDDVSPQTVNVGIVVCAYDEGKKRDGFRDVENMRETIVQRICAAPYFGGVFTVLKPITWANQQDNTHPYYYGACSFTCTAPAMTQDTELEDLL